MECEDFLEFQDSLKKMREVDDKIIYMLNTTIPTNSFRSEGSVSNKCEQLFSQLQSSYGDRENAIKKCVSFTADKVKSLRSDHEANPDNPILMKLLKKEQNKAKLLQTELNVEEVIKDRSLKLYYERCRSFYKPSSLHLQ